MGDKKERIRALSNFTRNVNTLTKLLDNSSPNSLTAPQFDKMNKCWERLEEAQDKYLESAEGDMDIETDKDGVAYLDAPSVQYNDILVRYATHVKTSEAENKEALNQQEKDDEKAREENRRKIESDKIAEDTRLRNEELKMKFDSAAAELSLAIDTFGSLNIGLQDSLTDASVTYKRKEWQRVEKDFELLKQQLVTVSGNDCEKLYYYICSSLL